MGCWLVECQFVEFRGDHISCLAQVFGRLSLWSPRLRHSKELIIMCLPFLTSKGICTTKNALRSWGVPPWILLPSRILMVLRFIPLYLCWSEEHLVQLDVTDQVWNTIQRQNDKLFPPGGSTCFPLSSSQPLWPKFFPSKSCKFEQIVSTLGRSSPSKRRKPPTKFRLENLYTLALYWLDFLCWSRVLAERQESSISLQTHDQVREDCGPNKSFSLHHLPWLLWGRKWLHTHFYYLEKFPLAHLLHMAFWQEFFCVIRAPVKEFSVNATYTH